MRFSPTLWLFDILFKLDPSRFLLPFCLLPSRHQLLQLHKILQTIMQSCVVKLSLPVKILNWFVFRKDSRFDKIRLWIGLRLTLILILWWSNSTPYSRRPFPIRDTLNTLHIKLCLNIFGVHHKNDAIAYIYIETVGKPKQKPRICPLFSKRFQTPEVEISTGKTKLKGHS